MFITVFQIFKTYNLCYEIRNVLFSENGEQKFHTSKAQITLKSHIKFF